MKKTTKLRTLAEAYRELGMVEERARSAQEQITEARLSRQPEYKEDCLADATMELDMIVSDCRESLKILNGHIDRLCKQRKGGRK